MRRCGCCPTWWKLFLLAGTVPPHALHQLNMRVRSPGSCRNLLSSLLCRIVPSCQSGQCQTFLFLCICHSSDGRITSSWPRHLAFWSTLTDSQSLAAHCGAPPFLHLHVKQHLPRRVDLAHSLPHSLTRCYRWNTLRRCKDR